MFKVLCFHLSLGRLLLSCSIVLPNRLCDGTILVFPTARTERCVIDARSVVFVEPIGLVQLALLIHRAASLSDTLELLAPEANVDTYLGRMHFYDRIPQTVMVVGSTVAGRPAARGSVEVLVELIQFETYWEVEDVVARVVPFLHRIGLSMPVYSALKSAISELCDNAAAHSQSPCGGFVAAQTYQSSQRYLAVGDVGMGIRKHLGHNPRYAGIKSDAAAISEALKPHVTGTSDRRGWGFEEVLDALKGTGLAQLTIYSGSGRVRVSVSKEDDRIRKSSTSLRHHFPGTLIQIVMSD